MRKTDVSCCNADDVCSVTEGVSADEARSGLDAVCKEWDSCQNLIQDLRDKARVLERVAALLSGLKAVDGVLQEQEKRLISTEGFEAINDPQELQTLKDKCEVSQILAFKWFV